MSREQASARLGSGLLALALVVYGMLIVYGSLFPFSDWQSPSGSPFEFLRSGFDGGYGQSDFVVNILAYLPLGFLLFVLLARRMPGVLALVLASLCGTALSLTMESIQSYLPFRVSSVGDLIVNAMGTLLGAWVGWLFGLKSGPAAVIHRLHLECLRPGLTAETGFWFAWLAFFFTVGPLAPALSDPQVHGTGWASFGLLKLNLDGFGAWAVVEYALQAFGLLVLCMLCMRADKPLMRRLLPMLLLIMGLKFAIAVLFLKVPPQLWAVSVTALAGLGLALVLLWSIKRFASAASILGLMALLAAFLMGQLSPWQFAESMVRPMNVMPFGGGHMLGSTGIIGTFSGIAGFIAIGFMVNLVTPARLRRMVIVGGAVLVTVLAFATEWAQQFLPGRYADMTDVSLAIMGWCVAWLWPALPRRRESRGDDRRTSDALTTPLDSGRWWAVAAGLVCVLATAGIALFLLPSEFMRVQSVGARLGHPDPDSLAPVSFPEFRYAHPRLPAPSQADIELIRANGNTYFDEQRRLANGGRGELDAAITMAFVEPGTQDLELIFKRLMQIPFHYRANGTEIVAKGYDWLYASWSDEQRQQLRGRLIEGFDFAYRVIREQRLSPYNVYWYNSPFQRLLMLAIVLYGDDERGEGAMRVAHHLLINEMLPVWRQVMGQNGGWHEGGEYVGVGIGQAVWRVPAMWRNATGEDLFASESYLKGFLDFLIYRQRPDRTHFRWGDARNFDRAVPDQYALAMEYGYLPGLWPSPYPARAFWPASWPWGPVVPRVPPELIADARDRLPLSRLFDGMGLVVARSDWSEDASYVTFKAGDSYWSHVNLDQGAFTIYKGGALAIDSGLYGPSYGSDHHMNYTYQTIAHNTITVHDPRDTYPMQLRDGKVRPIANDGGQRRVGSGWGVDPAPLNLSEWESRHEIYHTGRIMHFHEGDGLVIAVADITPAYTNRFSGRGTFSHRTRRVERAYRVFAYDQLADAVIVYDDVEATRSDFRKRWLLHSIEPPLVTENGFKVWISPAEGPGRAGGYLEGHVLYPLDAHLLTIGGPGFEFFVDGVNYDEGGEVQRVAQTDARLEVGAWRLELMPGRDSEADQFLVVMFPRLTHEEVEHSVTRLTGEGRIGVQIDGGQRSTRWWFTPGKATVEVELDEGVRRTIRLGD